MVRKKFPSDEVRPVTIRRPGKVRTAVLLVSATVLAAGMPVIATLCNPTSPYDGLFTAIVQKLDVYEEVVALVESQALRVPRFGAHSRSSTAARRVGRRSAGRQQS